MRLITQLYGMYSSIYAASLSWGSDTINCTFSSAFQQNVLNIYHCVMISKWQIIYDYSYTPIYKFFSQWETTPSDIHASNLCIAMWFQDYK